MASIPLSVPPEYLCPITHDIMKNPVILIEDGCSYDELDLSAWLQNHNTSPWTNNVLTNRQYIPNRALKSLINDFIAEQQISSRTLTEDFLAFNICQQLFHSDWKYQPTIRIVLTLLGSSEVGKTILAQCLQYGYWPKNMNVPPATVGSNMNLYYLDKLFQNKYVVVIQLNDPAGEERFEALTTSFFRQCHGALLLTDTTAPASLDRLEQYWYPRLEQFGMDNVQTTLVCTKTDLFEKKDIEHRESFLQHAQDFAFARQMPIIHVSSYRGDNVKYVFKQLIIRILENKTLLDGLITQATSKNSPVLQQAQISPIKISNSLQINSDNEIHGQGKKKKCCN